MSYILNLRKKIGHDPIIMCASICIILNEKNEILLQKRKDNHTYAIPGGSLELNETFEEACKREIKEETGLTLNEIKFYKVNSNLHYIYPNNDEVYISEVVYICNNYEGELKVQEDEVIEQKFYNLDDLPLNIFEINKKTLKDFKEDFINKKIML